MSVVAEESPIEPDETGETGPVLSIVPDSPDSADGPLQEATSRGFLIVAARVAIGVVCLAGLAVLGFIQAFGGPGLLIAGGAVAAAGVGWMWSKSGRKNKAGVKSRAGEKGLGKRASGAGRRGGGKGASGGLGKRLAAVLPKRSGSTQKRGAGSAPGGKPKASKLGALGKRLGNAKKAASAGASKLSGKRPTGGGKGASRRRFGASKLNPFKAAGKASKGASGGAKRRSGAKRGSGVTGTLVKPFKAGRARLKARKAARTEATTGGTRKRSRGPVRAAWKASRTGSPRKVWRATRKSVATRGRTARSIAMPLSMLAGFGFIAGRWAWRSGKRRTTAWWANHSWQVRNGFRKAGNKVRAKLGRKALPLFPPPTPVTDPLWDTDDDVIPADIPAQRFHRPSTCMRCGDDRVPWGASCPNHPVTGEEDPDSPWTCHRCRTVQIHGEPVGAGPKSLPTCPNCISLVDQVAARSTDDGAEWFVANPKENAMSVSEAPLPDEDAGMLEVREFVRREQEAAEEMVARAKTLQALVDSSPFNPAAQDAAEEYIRLLEMIAEAAQDFGDMFDSDHADDFERLERSRVGEEKWDKSRNDV